MAERWHDQPWAQDMWWSGKTTRRTFLGFSAAAAGALGASLLVPAPWREAFGQAKPLERGWSLSGRSLVTRPSSTVATMPQSGSQIRQ